MIQALYNFSPSAGKEPFDGFRFYADTLSDAVYLLQKHGYTGYIKEIGTDNYTKF